eukprot:c24905_g1_i1 orf=336-3284(+)
MASTSTTESSSFVALPASFTQIVQSNQQYGGGPHLNEELSTSHDIYLSHSRFQRGFAKELYKELNQNFSTFIDITLHSLSPGENWPKRILDAACTCKLAVVILSEEFVCSMWPMIELSVFVDAMPSGVRILPLFFKLSPSDLNNESNLTRWVTSWELFAKQDSRIVVSKWKEALRILGLQNGLIFDAATEGELAYSYRIVASISQIIPSAIKYDTHYVHGKDRLCKVVLDKFKEMETQECNSVALPSSKDLSTIARPKVLGLYGLPGSGKSTICKCLQGCFFPIYPGKTLYLELPTNPSPAKLVNVFKMLLRLTDFRDKMDLDHRVLELEQVQFLLRSYQLQSCSVFLVIDNISDNSWEAVQRILHVGFGLNSKIILVARTFDILRPILNSLKREHHYICDSLCIPYIDEREAKEILMQTIRPGLGGYVPQRHLTPEQTEIILHIVRLCGFGPESSRVYLPLVMNIMGAMLVKYDGDLEEWGRDSQGFWTGVKSYKEDAVKKLVGESFKTLPNEEFQVLFMDVALFILPSGRLGYHEVRALLGFMHDKSASRMHKMLKDLERYCFLTVDENGIGVHDVYLDFAKSMQEDSSGFMKWSWRNDIYTDGGALLLKEEQTTKGEHQLVRTMILEVKGCEKVELQSFSGLKAVVIRGCKSLRVLRLSGLRSLVSLEIVRCASLQQIECGDNDYTSLRNVKRLKMEPQTKGEGSRMQEEQQVWHPFSYLLQWVIAPDKHSNVLNRGIASHMRGLQVLCLEETGIRRLDDMSSYWPQLQHINVIEDCLESFVVGKLLKLKRFHFNDVVAKEGDPDFYRKSESWKRRKGNPRFMLQGKNLLEGCPELEEVDIQSAFFEGDELGTLPQSIVALELSCFYTATKLPDLSLFHKLERLTLRCCEKLERVNLPVGLRNLKDLELSHCSNVVEVSGLGSLRSLRSLRVSGCPKLQPFVGSNNWRMLQEDPVCDFPLLSEQNRCVSLESLTNLEEL